MARGPLVTRAGYHAPRSSNTLVRVVFGTVIMTLLVLAILPFTQALSGDPRDRTIRSINTANIAPPEPPPPEPPPPPEEEEEAEEEPELEEPPQRLNLSQLEAALNPGFGSVVGDAIDLSSFDVSGTLASEILTFELRDLDRRPRRLRAVPPNFPLEFQQQGLRGVVKVVVLIDEEGNVTVEGVEEATHDDAVQPVRQAVSRWKFEPPQKDGQAVRARYVQPINYDFSQ